MIRISKSCFTFCVASAISLLASPASGQITFPVTFDDPGGNFAAYYPVLTTAIEAAGAEWAHYLNGTGELNVEVVFTNSVAFAPGGSVTSGFVRNNGTRDIFEQGAAYKLRTNQDPNGADPDIRILINPDYLANNLWFDPHPAQRTDPIPPNRTDAISVFTHELGHAFVFNGWMDGNTGALPATYMSTFDGNVQFDGMNFYFLGANASNLYGGQIPITYGNPFHLGNNPPRPGSNLLPDLMNGVVFNYQARYTISSLDLKIARDCGVNAGSVNIQIDSIVRSNGNVLISGRADPDSFVRISAAPNLTGPGTVAGTVPTDAGGHFQYPDSGAVGPRFYSASYP